MTTYYVKTGGDDGNAGTSEALAWATPSQAFATAVAGDTVYIAPGTYRNTSGWTLTNAGSSGSPITYFGDVNCEYFTNENPGYVRLTGCDATELPSCAAHIIDRQKDYVTFENIWVDGTAVGSYNGFNSGSGTDRINIDCKASASNYGFYYGTNTNCYSVGQYGFYNGTNTNCYGAGQYGFYNGTNTNCYGAGRYGFNYGTNTNCYGAGQYGFYYGTNTNCYSVGSFGFSYGTNTNCYGAGQYGFNGGTLSGCLYGQCQTGGYTGTITGDNPTAGNFVGHPIGSVVDMMRPLMPMLDFEPNSGDDSVLSTITEDILGNPLRQGDGTLGIGPWAHADISYDWTNYNTNAPGVYITRKGTKLITIPCTAASHTVTAYVKHNSTSNKPSLTASSKSDSITLQTNTATGDGSTWEQLSVTFTPSFEDIIEIRINNNDTTSGSYAIFSDITPS